MAKGLSIIFRVRYVRKAANNGLEYEFETLMRYCFTSKVVFRHEICTLTTQETRIRLNTCYNLQQEHH